MRDKDDWSDDIHIFHDFNDGDHLFLAKGWIVWAGNAEGGMKVRLGEPRMQPNGVVIPFEGIEGTWTEPPEEPKENEEFPPGTMGRTDGLTDDMGG